MNREQPSGEPAAPIWPHWLEKLYACADALDGTGFARHFTAHGSMRFGNSAPLVGPREIEDSLRDFFSSITLMKHRPVRIWEIGDESIFEAVVTYGRPDGTTVQIPAVTAYTRSGNAISSCRIYCDMTPVFARSQAGDAAAQHRA